MGVTVVVGGQYGSEGKGKVAQHLARAEQAEAVVRIGGSNSGHTGFDSKGAAVVLRQLPTAALLPDVTCVIGPGSYIDPTVLRAEVARTNLGRDRLLIDPNAVLIDESDLRDEAESGLRQRIGSTCSGTGAAVLKRVSRLGRSYLASESSELGPFIRETSSYLRQLLGSGGCVLIEGTQGFGLSVLHSPYYPRVTTRDTSAAGAVSEAGLSPLDVEKVVLVLRTFPIRVAGNSGPLQQEIDWQTLARESGYDHLQELSSVTQLPRRVGRFEPEIVRRAIRVNAPTDVVLNHADYIDADAARLRTLTPRVEEFIVWVESEVERPVTWVGVGPDTLLPRRELRSLAVH